MDAVPTLRTQLKLTPWIYILGSKYLRSYRVSLLGILQT